MICKKLLLRPLILNELLIELFFQMILMMVLPLLLITVLPKMMNDPETKREMEQMHQSMNVQNQVIKNFSN